METEIAKDVEQKINLDIEDNINSCIKDIRDHGGFEPVLVLYDTEGCGHIPPFEINTFLKFPQAKVMFIPIMKKFLEFLKDQHDTTIIKSALYQCVYYSKAHKEDFDKDEYMKKHGSVSQDPDAEEAVMILTEDPKEIHTRVYHTIYSDDNTTGVVNETPMQDFKTSKDSPDRMESWMVGIFD